MSEDQTQPVAETEQLITHPDDKIRLLLVDDEDAILRSLKRVFRGSPYEVSMFTSAQEALEFLQDNTIDVVISDMRMPHMDGLAFLTKVAELYPAVVRIVLSGYADLESVIDVVNQAKIYSYVTKPWDETDLRLKVRNAAEKKYMKFYIKGLIKQRNDDLQSMNEQLEEKVRKRTEELETSHRGALEMIAFFAGQGKPRLQKHSECSARLASRFGGFLGLGEREVQDVVSAARLHDIGLAVMEEACMDMPLEEMTKEQRRRYEKHPVLGEKTLMGLPIMKDVAVMVRHHHERFNGEGFPDGLAGERIPLGSRMLNIINDYDNMVKGNRYEYKFSHEEALNVIKDNAFENYDPKLAKAFYRMMVSGRAADFLAQQHIWALTVDELRPGMTLYENLLSKDGMLLLTSGQVLNETLIKSLKHVEELDTQMSRIYVLAENDETAG